jgi:tetratricopeptide (TPR) repeat protein
MRSKWQTRAGIFLAILVASVGSRMAEAQQSQVGNIVGEIKVSRLGLPDKQILVNLQTRGANVNSAYADSDGRFGFYSLPDGVYNIVIQDDDYAPANEQVVLNLAVSTTAYARIMLTRKERSSGNGTDRLPGSNPNVVDLAEYTRKFPKKAVKEYEKGLRADANHDEQNALEHFQKCVELTPDFYPAHNELGRILTSKSDFASAEREFREVIRLNQSDAEGHVNLGNVFLLTKKYDDAMKSVEEGLRRDPRSAMGHFIQGSIYERTGKYHQAEQALRQALQLDPTMSKVHLELVNLYLIAGMKPEAAAELRLFLKDFPNDPFAPKAREVLAKLSH